MPDQNLHANAVLTVAGKIVGQSLFITSPASWSDFVFSASYKLRPLPELVTYIQKNQHLPDMPAASEAMRTGYDVSQMNAKLLQKVEELTLYILELNERIITLEKEQKP